MSESHVILCLGSNVEPRLERINEALIKIAEVAAIQSLSEAHESDDITNRSCSYINMLVCCRTELSQSEFTNQISEIETICGRNDESYITGVVEIDIDIVIWNNEIVAPDDYNRPYFQFLYNKTLSSNQCITEK